MLYCAFVKRLIPVLALGAVVACAPCRAQFLIQGDAPKSGLVDTVESGQIDWGNGYFYASGEGAVPSADQESNRARALLKARGYAKMKAIADLRMVIDGTTISYKAVGRDCTVKDAELRQTIEGYVSNVEIVGEKQVSEGGDTIVVVTVRAPMYGSNGIGSAFLRSKSACSATRAGDVTLDRRGDAKALSVMPTAKGPFSSLIVDCAGLDVQRAMSPKIRRPDGSELWGTMQMDPDILQDRGIVAYARTVDEAKRNPRAGSNPIAIRAIGRAGGRYYCDAIISDTDADRVLQENEAAHFLNKCSVIFAVDGS